MTNSKVFYPMEAFALAMVLCSGGMKEAMLAGMGLILGDVLLYVLQDNFQKKYQTAYAGIGMVITVTVLGFCWQMAGLHLNVKMLLAFAFMAELLVKHHEDLEKPSEEAVTDYNMVLWGDSIAYGFLVLLAILREFLAGGAVFEVKLTKWSIMSHAFATPMFALIFAGIMVAVVNAVLKAEYEKDAAVWVCVPVIILEAPFAMNNVPEWAGTVIGIVFMLILYSTFRKKITQPVVSKNFKGIPVELVTLGMMYMVFSIL